MRYLILNSAILLMLSACGRRTNASLQGSEWTSNFYHYQNKYYFLTESTGFSKDGQFLWSTLIDPALYNNSRDSIDYSDPVNFTYTLKDTVLTIEYTNGVQEKRVFYKAGDSLFISEYEYAYGKEGIEMTGRIK
ncbi:MAG: hypothetical protein K0S32_3339 [Bacteroidetes bacterium]|jgi:hypothetical protein|nr:hypothetical protein [Bacteroidota bacterium]